LQKAGCETIFRDQASEAKSERAGLADALAHVRKGDVLVVWKLDRLGRSLPHLIATVIDTTTPGGRLIFHVFGALGQFERDLIRDRTLSTAAARGRIGKTALYEALAENP
jgi:DNA invertase Pin-like site-specific DNA recombinase